MRAPDISVVTSGFLQLVEFIPSSIYPYTVMKIYGQHDQKTLDQFRHVMNSAEKGALMADGHIGYVMPIGGVAAYKNRIALSGVGYDIACGNLAVKLDLESRLVKPRLSDILEWIQSNISFGIGRKNREKVDDAIFDDNDAWLAYDVSVRGELKKLAADQLGTIGSGNHYVDIFEDEKSYTWIGVHFGSRGLGHRTTTGFMNLALSGDWKKRAGEKEVILDLNSELGERYYRAMKLSGRYAYAGRGWVVHKIANYLQAEVLDTVHNHHNYAWEEIHDGENYIVVRKGATPAFPGQRGFVGGSMGDNAVIVEGVKNDESKTALYSTVHGAGRVMSRTEAKGKIKRKKNKKAVKVKEGRITREMMENWLRRKKIVLRGGGRDEAPQVYRRLNDVLNEHQNTINIIHTLKPLGVVMAGENEFDPYRD